MITELTRNTLVLILAGGEGSRLKDLTKWRAKPAVPFGGKYRIIDFALSNCVNSGLRKIGVLTQYKSHSLLRHLQRGWGFMRAEIGEFVELLPAQQRTSEKAWYKGTADALFQNMDIMQRHNTEYVIVLGGDHIYTMDYAKMLLQHVQSGADFTVGAIEVPVAEATDFGVLAVSDDMRITSFDEKPAQPKEIPGKPGVALASMGIYVFSKRFLYESLSEDAIDPNSSHDFGKDIIPDRIKDSVAMAYSFKDEKTGLPAYWRDVGTLESYWKANMELCAVEPELNLYDRSWTIWTYQTQNPPAKFVFDEDGRRGEAIDSLISAGCIVSGASVKRSVLSFATTIDSHSIIRDSVILPKVVIGKNCRITRAIIDKECEIPDNTIIGENLEDDKARFHVSPEGIVLITPEMLGQYTFPLDGLSRWREKS
ncbi:glucose-1-phosphate adenylyltransferase [Leucothrix arctica]|uniref:Glucose-1-phosphate adenylyltransferase n=2 Tax=Leucothrix arctica TaxID=1481894 RepID=A0A317C5T7_9GAMM|nr:glucose-1-phosphate adenylyltransferase [Leucothrix arctica]PWQ93996.1 glucose-1-phosphate adenylyltransferase [Leucothrix arctica]